MTRTPLLLLLLACGVEETGYLTDQGVLFTTAADPASKLLVVRPDAVSELGGDLSGVTSTGEVLLPQLLSYGGAAWPIADATEVTLTYTLDDREDTAAYSVFIDPGGAPVENTGGLVDWAMLDGDSILLAAGGLNGDPPLLVVNQDNGRSVVLLDQGPQRLDGGSGDTVCAASLVGDALTASVCKVVD